MLRRSPWAGAGWRRAALPLLVFAWLAVPAGLRPLMLPDEGRYAGVAWEMLRSGDWLTPTLDGLPFFHKPPLFYWLAAGAMRVAGVGVWTARLPSLLGAWAGAWALFLFLRRWSPDPARARLVLVVLLAQPMQLLGAQFANLDMLVAGCISACVLCGAHAALCVESGLPHRHAVLGAWALAALGVLAKGLIGIVIPGAVLVAWLLLRRRGRTLAALLWWPAPLLFAAIAAPWFVAMGQRFADFWRYFFVVQHFQRYAAGGFNNVQPFWFYPAVLLLASLPWLPALAGVARRAVAPPRLPWSDRAAAVPLLMGVWLLLVVGFFSLPASKLLGYVLPAVPPLAYCIAAGAEGAWQATTRQRWWPRVAAAVSVAVCWALVATLALKTPHSSRELAHELARGMAPGDAVVALHHYPYDLPFYARLRMPLVVVDEWQAPMATRRDDWRKELADAGSFAPRDAAATLVEPSELAHTLCAARVNWIVGDAQAAQRHPLLALADPVWRGGERMLWRLAAADPVKAAALGCGRTPSSGWPGR